MTLNYTSPLYMALFASVAAIRMGRSLNFGLLAAIVAGFIGVILALKPELHSGQEFAALIGLSAGFSSALAYSQVKELSRVGEPEWRIVFYFTLFGTVTGLIGHIATEGMLHPVRLNDLPGLLGIGIPPRSRSFHLPVPGVPATCFLRVRCNFLRSSLRLYLVSFSSPSQFHQKQP